MRINLLVAAVALRCLSAEAAQQFYVSPAGNDTNAGDSEHPFATIERARDEIRRLKARQGLPVGGVNVEIFGGTYHLQRSIEFSSQDSGSAGSPIVYRAFQRQPVRLVGGWVIRLAQFKPVTDPPILRRLEPAARQRVLRISTSELGLQHAGPFPPVFNDSGGLFELFCRGERMPLARWPNRGYVTMKRVLVNGNANTGGTFEYRDERPARWVDNPYVWLRGKWRVGWEDPAVRVGTIDTNRHTITFAAGIPNGIGSKYRRPAGDGKEPWCALNLVEEIDQPGEWAVDFATHILYFWPPTTDPDTELMISQLDQPMIRAVGAAHLAFEGLTLECALGDGFVMEKAESDVIAGCTIRNLSRRAVVLDGSRSGVRSCDIHHVGEGCVLVSGGDRQRLIPSGDYVVNNHLHHYGLLKGQYSAAVDTGFGGLPSGAGVKPAVGIRVANNLVHDAPRDAFLVSGQDNVFEYNEVYHCGYDTTDTGVFYSWLDWTIRGIVIRYNYLHDTVGGVNPDDGASGSLTYGNIFAGPRVGVWIASGPDHTIENNVFIKLEGPVFAMDDRGVGRGYATNARLHKAVLAVNPAQPPWSTRFPQMAGMLEQHPELPWRTKVARNVIVIQKGEPSALKMSRQSLANPDLLLWQDNFVTAQDPGFVDAAKGNFALKPDSIVFQKIPGFKPIPVEKIGLFKDQYRTALPTDAEAGRDANPFRDDAEKNFGT